MRLVRKLNNATPAETREELEYRRTKWAELEQSALQLCGPDDVLTQLYRERRETCDWLLERLELGLR